MKMLEESVMNAGEIVVELEIDTGGIQGSLSLVDSRVDEEWLEASFNWKIWETVI